MRIEIIFFGSIKKLLTGGINLPAIAIAIER